jgi:hypothetical protein
MAFCSKCGNPLAEGQAFCSSCGQRTAPQAAPQGAPQAPAAAAPYAPPPGYMPPPPAYAPAPPFVANAHPVDLYIERPETSSRMWALFSIIIPIKPIALFVQYIVLYFYQIAFSVLFALGQLAVLFTGRFPQGWHAFMVRVMYWQARINAFSMGLRDEFPPFSATNDRSAVSLVVPYPEKSSRGWAIMTILWIKYTALIPIFFVLYFRMIGAFCVWYVSQWAVLFTGQFPPRMHSYLVRVNRWNMRVNSFTYGLRDEYPPFGVN